MTTLVLHNRVEKPAVLKLIQQNPLFFVLFGATRSFQALLGPIVGCVTNPAAQRLYQDVLP
jgi:hypothetical protein